MYPKPTALSLGLPPSRLLKRNFSVGLYKKPRRKNIWDNDEVLKND